MKLFYAFEKFFQAYLGHYPKIYYPVYQCLRGESEHVVTKSTEIVIEGYPRVGNSFAVGMLRCCQSKQISIASHLHVVSQLIRAKDLRKPLILLVRDPLSAVTSLVIRDQISARLALIYYINYYQYALRLIDYPLVVDFEDLVSDYPAVIESVNKKFKENFDIPVCTQASTERALANIDEHYRHVTGMSDVSMVSSAPSEKRDRIKKAVSEKITSECGSLLSRAEQIYERVLAQRHNL